MAKKILLASYNGGKIERFKRLIAQTNLDIEAYSPMELGLEKLDIEENGSSLAENAEIKARAFFGKVDMPILSNDTGFWVKGEGLVEAPKRLALGNKDEHDLSKEEIFELLKEFWKGIATKYGGEVDAAWVEAFAVLEPDGTLHIAESRREVLLTDREFGTPHIQFPMRGLYLSKATNKPAVDHTPEEELVELQPVTEALIKVLS